MKSLTTVLLSRVRAAASLACFVTLVWNLASFGAVVNGREAFARAMETGSLSLVGRLGLLAALLALAGALELAATGGGAVRFQTRGIARLQAAASVVLIALGLASAFAIAAVGDDPRAFHEWVRRALGTHLGAGSAALSLAALSLFAFQVVEAASLGGRGRLSAVVGFGLGLAIFALGLRALAPLVSGAPLLPQ